MKEERLVTERQFWTMYWLGFMTAIGIVIMALGIWFLASL